MLYFAKTFNNFQDGIESMAQVSKSIAHAITHNSSIVFDEDSNKLEYNTRDLRAEVEAGLIENDMDVITYDYITHYTTGGGVAFGWLQNPESPELTFYVGFPREGSITKNAIAAGFKQCQEVDIKEHMANYDLKTNRRITDYYQKVEEEEEADFQESLDRFLAEHSLTRQDVKTLPTYSEKQSTMVSVQRTRVIENKIDWEQISFPCVVRTERKESSNACSRRWYHEDLYVNHDVSFRLFCDCSSSDDVGSNEKFGHPLEEL